LYEKIWKQEPAITPGIITIPNASMKTAFGIKEVGNVY
jgi:hypothetical protein